MQIGPEIDIEVHVPQSLAKLLTQQNQTIPSPVAGKALVDTGASITCVDDNVIRSLGVQPVGIATVHTPSGSAQQNQYPVRFAFPGSGLPPLEIPQAMGSILQGQGIIALLGRDLLASLVFIYNGPLGIITLAL
jgi:hypothetical protein